MGRPEADPRASVASFRTVVSEGPRSARFPLPRIFPVRSHQVTGASIVEEKGYKKVTVTCIDPASGATIEGDDPEDVVESSSSC